MSGEANAELLKEIKGSMDVLLGIVKAQSTWQTDTSLLLSSLSGKVEISSERIRKVEAELKSAKGQAANENTFPKTLYKEDGGRSRGSPAEMPQTYPSQPLSLSVKEEILNAVQHSNSELRAFIRDEIARVTGSSASNSSEVIARVEKAQELVTKPMAEMAKDVKKSVSAAESFEKGVRTIENALNDYNQKILPREELETALKDITDKFDSASHGLKNQIANIEKSLVDHAKAVGNLGGNSDLPKRLDSLVSDLADIKSEFKPKGKVYEMLFEYQTPLILDQLLAEHHITRRMLQNTSANARNRCKIFDFFVTRFNEFQSSGLTQDSRICYIDTAGVYIKGNALFDANGTLEIWINHGKYPRLTGIEHVQNNKRLLVKVSVLRRAKPLWELGTTDFTPCELNTSAGCDGRSVTSGKKVAQVACDKFKTDGYYHPRFNRIMLRFDITLL